MSLYKPNFPEDTNGLIIGSAEPSELTLAIIKQFAECTCTENQLRLPERMIFLN